MLVSITFVIDHEEILKKDFAMKDFLTFKGVAIITNSPSIINMSTSLFLELFIIYPRKSK